MEPWRAPVIKWCNEDAHLSETQRNKRARTKASWCYYTFFWKWPLTWRIHVINWRSSAVSLNHDCSINSNIVYIDRILQLETDKTLYNYQSPVSSLLMQIRFPGQASSTQDSIPSWFRTTSSYVCIMGNRNWRQWGKCVMAWFFCSSVICNLHNNSS